VFRGDQANESGQLARIVEARQVSQLGDDRDRDDPLNSAQGLQSLDDGEQAPLGSDLEKFRFDATQSLDLLVDGVLRFLEDDLLRRGRADDFGQVAEVGVVPIRPSGVLQSQSKQKRLQAELCILEGEPSGIASAGQIANGFILDARDVHRRKIAGA
jgi:hypothetical protein